MVCSGLECFDFTDPPEFIRPPPSLFCDGSFDEQFTCSTDIPFPFSINIDASDEKPNLAAALVCSIFISIILTVCGVLIWRYALISGKGHKGGANSTTITQIEIN